MREPTLDEYQKLESRVCYLESWSREVAEHIREFTGMIVEPPDPEEEDDD